MPNINKKLVLNKHPKDCEDLVLINARNVKVSNDFSCLQSENSIFHNKVIESFINNNFGNDWNIAGVIPCNVELILIVYKGDSFPTNASIVRYNEDKNSCEISYNKFEYHGGEIKGTFTYNVQSNLILSIAEYNTKFNIPLRTINIGKFGINGDDTDVNLKNGLLSNAPEVYIPKLVNQEYTIGNAYKGWYNFFIRFKINKVDYTSWFHLGYPIFVSDIIERDIIKYYYSGWINDLPDSSGKWKLYFMTGCSDYISDDTEIANETVTFDINGLNKSEQLGYKYYQIGFICATKDSQKAFKTNDIKINVTNYKLEINNCVTYSVTNLITDNYNFYNVKNIINYQNRLYIANYNEENVTNIDLSNIILRWKQENVVYDDYYKHSIYFADEKGCTDIETKVKTKQNNINRIIKRSNTVDTNTKPSYIKSDHFGKINLNSTVLTFKTSLFNQGSTETETAHLYNSNNEFIGNITLSWTRNGYGSQGGGYMQYDIDGIYNGVQYWHARGLTALNVPSEVQLTVSINNFKENGEISPDVSSLTSFDFINTNNSYNRRKKETTLIPGETYAFYIHFVNKYGEVSRGYKLPNNGRGNFNLVINKNGDALFKIPYIELSNFKDNIIKPRLTLQIDFGNTYIPNEYVGYFLTYEQFESTCKTTGVLTKFDFYNKEQKATKIASTVFTNKTILRNENYNAIDSDNLTTVKFYSSEFDITDNLELKYNKLRLEKKNCFDVQDWVYGDIDVGVTDIFIINPAVVNAKFAYNLNIPEKGGTSVNIEIPISKYNIKVAGDATEGQNGLGTCLEITLPTSTIKELFPNGEYVLYKASLLNDTTELYVNENKNLIKFTNIEYFAEGKVKEFKEGLNGHSTYNDFLIYNWNKFIFDSGKNVILNYSYNAYYPTWAFGSNFQLDDNLFKYSHPAAYLQLAVYKDKMLEAKSFKNPPKACVTQLSEASETEENQTFIFGNGCIVEPSDTVDLFKEKYYNQDVSNPKTYTNYDKNISYLNVYNKRIYRSNVIQDESNENAWRTFPLEGYKDITENKGNITNLLAMGTTLLVHTEHSLFMFNRDNTMKTQDKDVQLTMPDIFDVYYKEVFTSTLGICGLQDDRAWVADDFGYIFYDNDAHRLYQFGQGKVNNLDNDIIQWLDKYKPNRVRFANDKISNRLLIRFDYQDITKQDNKVISFNYKLGNYISFHDYIFEEGINTKNKLYLFTGRKDNQLKSIFNIDYSNITNTSYNNFENYTKQLINNSQIDILILGTYITDKGGFTIYDTVKYLEYLTYKLYKIDKSNEDYIQLPVEGLKLPYSGDTLRVFNHNVDTGVIDIKIDTEKAKNPFGNYKKPYWDLDNWNFSYLRNKGSQHDGKQIYGDVMSRLYGNYFIASFTFSDSERRVEFEDLKYNVTKDKKL